MIPFSPEARAADLLAMIARRVTLDDVSGSWRRGGEPSFLLSRSCWALQAIALWWRQYHDAAPCIWFPDFFCNESLRPLRETGAKIFFYPIGRDLNPRWAYCRTLAQESHPSLFVLVHYFGTASDVHRADAFCKEIGALLIEDAAHALGPAPGIGEAGDFVFYSPHKLLPVPDGSILVMRGEPVAIRLMSQIIAKMPPQTPTPNLWLIKQVIRKTVPSAFLPSLANRRAATFEADYIGHVSAKPRISRAALTGLASCSGRLAEIAERRRSNARNLARVLSVTDGWQALNSDNNSVPFKLVMRCNSESTAATRFQFYRRRGIPVQSWPDLPPEVSADPTRHAAAISLRQTLLHFPVHQTVDMQELVARCRTVQLDDMDIGDEPHFP